MAKKYKLYLEINIETETELVETEFEGGLEGMQGIIESLPFGVGTGTDKCRVSFQLKLED